MNPYAVMNKHITRPRYDVIHCKVLFYCGQAIIGLLDVHLFTALNLIEKQTSLEKGWPILDFA